MEKQQEWAPVLQRMGDYIIRHFGDEMLQEVEGCLQGAALADLHIDPAGDLGLMPGEGYRLFFDRQGSKLGKFRFYQVTRTGLMIHAGARIRLGIAGENQLPRYFLRQVYFITGFRMEEGIQRIGEIPAVFFDPPAPADVPELSDYLVPILRSEDMEELFRQRLRQALGDGAMTILRRRGPMALTQALGLTVRTLPLYQNRWSRAMLFLEEGEVQVATEEGGYEMVRVPWKTIVLNANAARKDEAGSDLAIYHECAHYEFHTMFLTLQQLHRADLRLLQYKEADKASRSGAKDVRWVERQADYFAYAAMLPRGLLVPLMRLYWEETEGKNMNTGDRVDKVIYRIARDLQRPKSLIRTRMILLGSTAAKGACNYVDGRYIRPFAFSGDRMKAGETFVIDRGSFTRLYGEDEAFRDLIRSRGFLYAEGHVCLDHPFYVEKTRDGIQLTEWARGHVDECCLKFRREYRFAPAAAPVGVLCSEQGFNDQYVPVDPDVTDSMTREETMAQDAAYLSALPRTPAQALSKLIADRCGTQREAAFRCGLSESMISRMCSDNTFRYDIRQVTRLAVGLSMPPPLSGLFMEMVGFPRMMMLNYYRYECIIQYLYLEDMETVEESHKELLGKT